VTDETRKGERPKIRVTDRRRFADGGSGSNPEPEPTAVDPAKTVEDLTAEDQAETPQTDELAEARSEAQGYLEHLQRLQAEFDNYRKRVLKEQTQAVERAAEPVMRSLLEVLDEFELALIHAEETQDFERFVKGVELVYAKLLDVLKAEGLGRIEADGKPFDPELHEALMQTGEGTGDLFVADVFRPGYTLRGRVIRPAGVRVERR
jgi:molecular chaperone GrpE